MRLIVVTGGVISGVGKGITTASIGKILQEYGFSVTAIKIDPYINCDAGTLRPTEHGEVWVTDDGGEIDQDLGNYERFLGIEIPKRNNITTGQVYREIIEKERRGGYLGKTVQFIPHVPEEIKRRIKAISESSNYDFIIVEIGGTIGDYENLPFLFAAKSLELDLGKQNVVHVLVSYLPVPGGIGEMKTKPTQQAIRMLNEAGIFPDFILCRSAAPLDEVRKKKIETNSNVESENIISAPDVKNIYAVPLNFEKERLGEKLLKRFGLNPRRQPQWQKWRELSDIIDNPPNNLNIAIIGKYVDSGNYSLADSYISIKHALEHAGVELNTGIKISWIDSKLLENSSNIEILKTFNGIVVPGGFGTSGIDGKIAAIRFARENNVPFLGLCLGMQLAVVEYARNVCKLDAHSSEIEPETKNPVIDLIPEQKEFLASSRYGASMRLGAYAAVLKEGSIVHSLYRKTGRIDRDRMKFSGMVQERLGIINVNEMDNVVLERHRHRYEVNPNYVEQLEKSGLVFSGFHRLDGGTKLMEFLELPNHKFFVATQAHPEFKSRLEDPAPLFLGFVEACSTEAA
ncbi:MAG: CTP synthase (glutamine hydrolyzing) [Candidatus Aenigmatarchaeota archaeon]